MIDPGLNQRLRQRSRRSGLMIGISMVATLIVCVAAFTFIYARLEPVVGDFVGRGDIVLPTPVPTQPLPTPTETPVPTETDEADTAEGGDNQLPTVAAASSDAFVPDYQVNEGRPVNLRPGPGVASGDAIVAVPQASPLMFLGDERATQDPGRDGMDPGQVWMRFRTQDGFVGWIREIDVGTYQP